MSGDRRSASFAEPTTYTTSQPSSPVPNDQLQTPRESQGPFSDSGGWTPKFAEDFSVFNSTPGNLRGSQGPFGDFLSPRLPATPLSASATHKRFPSLEPLSVEYIATEIAAQATHSSPDPNQPLPPLEPAARVPSTPRQPTNDSRHLSPAESQISALSESHLKTARAAEKARSGTRTAEPVTQTATPPPSSNQAGRKLAHKLNMQDEQSYGQPDFSGVHQQQDMPAFVGSNTDMFGYPMSAPAAAPANFWDPAAMALDMDFSNIDQNMFQQPATAGGHRSMGSFDWHHEPQLFTEPSPSTAPINSQNPLQPARHPRPLAPKPAASEQLPPTTSSSAASFPATVDDPFGFMQTADGVDPGMLSSRPQTSAIDISFSDGPGPTLTSIGRNMTFASHASEDTMNDRVVNRAYASSPVKSSRPGLGRSNSENRGRRAISRGAAPVLARPRPNGSATGGRPSGRISPFRHQKRLSALASIPESSPRPRPRASVRFTIDSKGRARAESTAAAPPHLSTSRSAHSLGRRSPESDDDSSESDDEPIIIPSRPSSFHASFALPDPLKPVGSIFTRSQSEKDLSSLSRYQEADDDDDGGEESEAETVVNGRRDGGDAASELRKMMEERQRRSAQTGQRYQPGSSTSPTPQNRSSGWQREGMSVRCECNENKADDHDGFMVQCNSCEMWLHGQCINITRRAMPNVYICAFCANTPNVRAGGHRRKITGLGLGMSGSSSPLASRSMRSFR